MRRVIAAAISIGILLSGCGESTNGPDTVTEIALFGTLYVGESVGEENAILITRTQAVEDYYDLDDAAVREAVVTLRKEGESRADTLRMLRPGYYGNDAVRIDSLTSYRLEVEIDGRLAVTAETRTPRPFRAIRAPVELPGTMRHAEIPDSFPITVRCADPEQIFYVEVYCTEDYQHARYVNPIGPDDTPQNFEEYGGENGPPRRIFAYFRLKNIEQERGDFRMGWYGDMMVFYGRYDVGVYSIDENYYNYLYKDHPELNGGVEGGIGVFGSACRRRFQVEAVK